MTSQGTISSENLVRFGLTMSMTWRAVSTGALEAGFALVVGMRAVVVVVAELPRIARMADGAVKGDDGADAERVSQRELVHRIIEIGLPLVRVAWAIRLRQAPPSANTMSAAAAALASAAISSRLSTLILGM